MRNRLFYVLLGASALVGCPGTTQMPDTGPPITLVDTGIPPDVGNHDVGTDTNEQGGCSGTGRIGAQCRSGSTNQCVNGAMCLAFNVAGMTINDVFGIPPGLMTDPAHMDYQLIDTSATPETADFNGAAGTICAQQCDTSVADTCGTCSSCSAALTQMPLVQAFGGILSVLGAAQRQFGTNTGICRLDCTYDRTTRGTECSDVNTCDQFSDVCVEACTSDNECNMAYGVTYEGELVTLVNHDHPDVCNPTTGRCEQPATSGSATANVGDHCTSSADCRMGTGICLNGGHCAEFGCPNPNTATSTCGGASNNLGICLTTSGATHPTSLCLTGCNTATDCGAGNICNTLLDANNMVVTIGTFTGYCIGVCQTDDQCLATEACTDYNYVDTMGNVVPNNGRCVTRCAMPGVEGTAGGCAATEWCSPDASNSNGVSCQMDADCTAHAPYTMCLFGVCRSSAPTFGECNPLGAFCGDAGTQHLVAHQGDCATTQVCDETLATPHDQMTGAVAREQFGDGHCVNPCATTADCTGYPTGSVCVTTGPYTGLCRVPCTGSATDTGPGVDAGMGVCPADQTCDGAAGFCVEVMTPTM